MPSLLKVRQHILHGLIAAVIVTALAAFALARVPYVPREPLAISREFVELIQAGDLTDAYRLTNHGAEVGRTLDAFEANIRHQLGIEAFPLDRSIALIGTHGGSQSYGNRPRRWIAGRKVDPDQVTVGYDFGLPFEISLTSDDAGNWRIAYFQSHAM
jgi:hypothetical protein